MNILHIIDSGGLYGAENMLLHLMAEQVSLGLNPFLASIGTLNEPEKPLETKAKDKGFSVLPFRMKPGANWAGAWKILTYARKAQIDILHSHGYKGNILFGLIPMYIRRVPMVTTLHGWTSKGKFYNKMGLYQELESFSLKFINHIVSVNSAILELPNIKSLQSSKLSIIENGIPILNINKTTSLPPYLKEFLDKGSTNFITIGRLSKEKGLPFLLEALAELNRSGIDSRLVIAGEGTEQSAIEAKIAALALKNRVLLTGFIPDIINFFQFFDAFILPSLSEGLPMVLLEAMSAGVPIIATQVGGIPNLLGNGAGGLLVEPGNALALSMAMKQCVANPKNNTTRTEWSTNRLKEHYTSRIMAEKYLYVYKKITKLI